MTLDEPMAGELNRRVQIRHRQDLPLADAELAHEFGTGRRRWAKIEPVGAATYAGSVQIDEKVTHRVFLRRIDGITSDHEIVHGDQVYRVRRSMAMNGAPRFTMVEVEEL
ncbi:head-tail adaptor protein [Herbaspirillum rubrisubalbicans Os34]|uniref:Head-tail adaptor protein n=1 Tax=Herbaspirillum rubrisubalbicans Os34 TaxID=1235827 RepID=A0A6M3ZX86_9BURK|nr:head-tail adaptor protein [Herbaspirillum rubrisubalbicans]QJQ02112.1 head-tail adaptor protein [Herbaspirillum rubrisubalbicans Os34]